MAPVIPFARSYAQRYVRPCTYSGWLAWRRAVSFLHPSLPLYREKLSYHANPCTAGNTSGQRFPYGDIRYLSVSGNKKGGAEKRSFETRDPLDRDASACVATRIADGTDDTESWYAETRRGKNARYRHLRWARDIVNRLRGKLKRRIRKRDVCAVET